MNNDLFGKEESPRQGNTSLPPEARLFIQAQAGCRECLDELMTRHDGLAHAVVRRQWLGDMPFAEALQAARIGLWRAIMRYDPHRRIAFSTYAWVSIMRHVWRAVKKYHRAFPPTEEGYTQEPTEAADPFLWWEKEEVIESLHSLVHRLSPRLRTVILLRYGLEGDGPLSYRQIGPFLNLSHERVRQLHQEALAWLRHPAHSYRLRSLLGLHTIQDYQDAQESIQEWLRRRGGRKP